jgi:hypothetical protein
MPHPENMTWNYQKMGGKESYRLLQSIKDDEVER